MTVEAVPVAEDPVVFWRYLHPRATACHALLRVNATVAVCGTAPAWFQPTKWLGTGSTEEYEHAAKLPDCRRCLRILRGQMRGELR